ncbi:MAG: hypothetical protein FH759_02565 [Sediminimonas qiaohouensis]|uniref:Uncharacterized protein n=1 Tax=Sediminimonas qiaohouensis TaxID=552061 RepID=A0A7C9H9M4_9RHOB|nr:DUF6477 family protein [Sediminimonas qiaohouensis]MTJ03566.1 hypothetical protein [Sediminimonas qiaohouensis]
MNDVLEHLDTLRRPRLLIRAARIGLQEYRRDLHLRRLLSCSGTWRSGKALHALIELEETLNLQRREGAAAYSACRHVDILIAMMAEARLLRSTEVADAAEPAP